MKNYEETLVFLTKMESMFYDYSWKAIAENDNELYYYSRNKILKINEIKEYIRNQYMNN